MIAKPNHVPERIASLTGAAAEPFLTEEFLRGDSMHGGMNLAKVVQPLHGEADRRWDTEPVRGLVEDAMYEYRDNRTAADGWLAPRLHATLRLTRREAADKNLWNHLALAVAPDYVLWRHLPSVTVTLPEPKTSASRFRGPADRQCFSRLWWAAELFRDGADYAPVVTACSNQDLIHTALRMTLIDHRPTAQALVRLLESKVIATGRDVNGLNGAINAAGATLLYDLLGPDAPRDPDPLRRWIEAAESAPPVPRKSLPEGPDEEPVPAKSIETLAGYFTEYFETAPIRGQKSPE